MPCLMSEEMLKYYLKGDIYLYLDVRVILKEIIQTVVITRNTVSDLASRIKDHGTKKLLHNFYTMQLIMVISVIISLILFLVFRNNTSSVTRP